MKATQDTVERWLPAVGFEGYYEVSDRARIRSVPRIVTRSDGGTEQRRGQVRVTSISGSGYRVINLYSDGRVHHVPVHRLMMAAFVGPCPDGMEVCHNNGVRDDNRLSNLRYDTPAANHGDRLEHGTYYLRQDQTKCIHGHRWDDPSSYYERPNGRRRCAVCVRAQMTEYRARKRREAA